jgi:23S rRNA (guanine745-N1)-methyltransferase
MDVILSILAPRNPPEFARILKPGGELILGVPGPNHLIELRARLAADAGDFEEKADEAAAQCAPHFVETDRDSLRYEQALHRAQIADLIQMTPIFWRSSPEAKASIQQLEQLTVTVSFALITLQRRT